MDSTVTVVANKALDMLQALATQLGVTLQYLWPRYVAFVASQAVARSVTQALVIVAASVLVKFGMKAIKNGRDTEEFGWFLTVAGGLATMLSVFDLLTSVGDAISAMVAPEGFALMRLLEQIKH